MESHMIQRLEPPKGKVRVVLDTDTYNEVDDQFAVVYALLSQEKMKVEAIYAAPFFNDRSKSPADRMEKSFNEINKILGLMPISYDHFVYKGSRDYLKDLNEPYHSDAALDLVKRAMASSEDDPLYVVAIGAITNVVSALLIEPEIMNKIVVVWLGGHALYWPDTKEFNLYQDIVASKYIFDCSVPLMTIPCMGVCSHLLTTLPELEAHIKGTGDIGDYLLETFKGYQADHFAYSKVIWDISTIAYLVNPNWVETNIVHRPILTDQLTWSFDLSRPSMRVATWLNCDAIYKDLFRKIRGEKE
ncbi:inosine-uridine nucleoside N-ribohydrolase [Pullulanibacillus pueri]|uniref:Inosine/uridine-preferring nucleoside hydrolase domain-containing protein n=1 Tax=Pullulanibacillus pueri TaxID=1437324 RepID=A0A8J3ELQ0_9BACL|nr:nucleoside hydrolase [Pullulanibacillus pueri]MBM7682108.1 inosine-uridine nucleoside N-ribohydrolase [Pullulanibacillus pueri]GGH79949.1 hypothetical protein GCM10007096_15630 [Pullulanibacillus pueri]